MPGFENKIWGIKYNEPYSAMCYKKVCVLGNCTKVPYPCPGMRKKYFDVYIGYNYPSVSASEQLTIHGCAKVAIDTATPIVQGPAATCLTAGAACIPPVAKAVVIANKVCRETFFACLKTAKLPQEVINKCQIGVYTRHGNA
ncbi:hypothetical protein [Bacillus velezensis]|uniref:hypothetical protein n=1 Tax=Bacillus velezensis TaxID=492670 RepID=UPI002E1BDF0B|nr:hypothetical protein [Bacillus velezensis]